MFIGKKIFPKTINQGEFYCPECRGTRSYEIKQEKNYFVFFYLPVFPLEIVGEYVECVECRNSFRKNVLESSPATTRAEFHPSMKRVMILMLLADGKIHDAEIEKIKGIYAKVAAYDLSDEEIKEEIEIASGGNISVKEYLKKVTPYLNNPGKARVIKSAYYVASADGFLHEDEEAFMDEISQALHMEPEHYESILDSLKGLDSEPIPVVSLV